MQVKKPSKQSVLNFIRGYAVMTLAGILNAVSLFTFVNPATLIAGGFSGLASALAYVFQLVFTNIGYDKLMSVIYFILNVPLLICSLVFLRGDFTFKTIWATVVSTVTLGILPQNFKFHDSRLISVIFGGIMIGFAMYIAYEENGSNGGTEIIAKIVTVRRPEFDVSGILLVANVIITTSGSIITMIVENAPVEIIIYSYMYIVVGANVLGMLKRGFNHPQKLLIITSEYEKIGAAITENFKRGYSCVDVENSLDGKTRKVITVVVQYRQLYSLKQIIKTYDPQAFTIIKDVYDVFSRPTFNRSYKK